MVPSGYTVVWTGEPEKEKETPMKKYQRLNCEVRELLEDIKTAGSSGSEDEASLGKVSVELEKLHYQLVQLRLEDMTRDDNHHVLRGGDVHTAKLINQLKQYQV